MNIKEIDSAYKEAFAMHELLRRVGFSADDVYLQYDDGTLSIILEAQGKNFLLEVGKLEDSFDEFQEKWKKFSFLLKTYKIDEDELQQIWHESLVYKNSKQILTILAKTGFVFNTEEEKKNRILN